MSKLNFLNNIKDSKKYLIDYANLINNLFLYQDKNSNKDKLKKILNSSYLGLPILFPKNLKEFNYNSKNNFYKIEKKEIVNKIFKTKNFRYSPYLQYIKYGCIFAENLFPKNKYNKIVNYIINFNNHSILKIKLKKKKYKKICSFQTRNIPHLGHEKIISYLLLKYDHVIVNPIIGPKKKGDVSYEVLEKVYNYLIKKKYKQKVSYIPIIANMFYAGPREAIHHANLRKSIGFSAFVVGRDHAGAENCYKPLSAYNLLKKNISKIPIKIENIQGAYFCSKCKKIVIKNNHIHKKLENISGTDFRKKIIEGSYFEYADLNLQKYIKKLKRRKIPLFQ